MLVCHFFKFGWSQLICILNNNSEHEAPVSTTLYRSLWINIAFFSLADVDGGGGGCQRKQKKSIDQRAPQIGYEGIKSLRSLDMRNYLVTGGLSSLVESCNNLKLSRGTHRAIVGSENQRNIVRETKRYVTHRQSISSE